MTKLTIVSGFTTIAQGRVDLGDIHLIDTTILDLKLQIREYLMDDNVPTEQLHLWWRGYRLDGDDQPVLQACVGANQGEALDPEAMETLVLFLTIPLERRRCDSDESSSSSPGGPFSPFRARSLSDLISAIRQELATTSSPKDESRLSCNIV